MARKILYKQTRFRCFIFVFDSAFRGRCRSSRDMSLIVFVFYFLSSLSLSVGS